MEHSFWFEKWENNEIGFHQSDFNRLLIKYWSSLALEKGSTVFVPFCGKSKDMLWLNKQGHKILGSELSKTAVKSFFQENNLSAENDLENNLSAENDLNKSLSAENDLDKNFSISKNKDFQIMVGDYFLLTPNHTRQVKAVYDRASLIALPPQLRKQYVNHMKKLLGKDCIILLITLEYKHGLVKPPPFSVQEKEVYELYSSWSKIIKLETLSAIIKEKEGFETVYRLEVKST